MLTLRLERSRHRQSGKEAKVYYRFVVVGEEALSVDGVQEAAVIAEEEPAERSDGAFPHRNPRVTRGKHDRPSRDPHIIIDCSHDEYVETCPTTT